MADQCHRPIIGRRVDLQRARGRWLLHRTSFGHANLLFLVSRTCKRQGFCDTCYPSLALPANGPLLARWANRRASLLLRLAPENTAPNRDCSARAISSLLLLQTA